MGQSWKDKTAVIREECKRCKPRALRLATYTTCRSGSHADLGTRESWCLPLIS
jgi:hypothetical protein